MLIVSTHGQHTRTHLYMRARTRSHTFTLSRRHTCTRAHAHADIQTFTPSRNGRKCAQAPQCDCQPSASAQAPIRTNLLDEWLHHELMTRRVLRKGGRKPSATSSRSPHTGKSGTHHVQNSGATLRCKIVAQLRTHYRRSSAARAAARSASVI